MSSTDEIPAVTYRTPNEYPVQSTYRILKLFVSDVLGAERVMSEYKFKGELFHLVMIKGIIVGIEQIKDFKAVAVHDSTDEITCHVESSSYVDRVRRVVEKRHEETLEAYKEKPDEFDRALLLMLRNLKYRLDRSPEPSKLNLGDKVGIVGKVGEFRKKRCIYVKKLVMLTDMDLIADNRYYWNYPNVICTDEYIPTYYEEI